MTDSVYPVERTGLLLVDPYNDFLSHGGKLLAALQDVADDVGLLYNLRISVSAGQTFPHEILTTANLAAALPASA